MKKIEPAKKTGLIHAAAIQPRPGKPGQPARRPPTAKSAEPIMKSTAVHQPSRSGAQSRSQSWPRRASAASGAAEPAIGARRLRRRREVCQLVHAARRGGDPGDERPRPSARCGAWRTAVSGGSRRPRTGHRAADRVLAEVGQRAPHVVHEQRGQVAADAVSHKDALDHQVLPVRRHRVGRHLPAAGAQPVGVVVEGVAGAFGVGLQGPGDRRDPGLHVAAEDDPERTHVGDLVGEVAGGVVAGLVHPEVALAA